MNYISRCKSTIGKLINASMATDEFDNGVIMIQQKEEEEEDVEIGRNVK